jgi:hypothetical protein
MIKKSPRLHQNYMQAQRERFDILNQEVDTKSDLSKAIEDKYRKILDHPVLTLAAYLEELLLQIRTIENMDEIKFGESGQYTFARTAFPRLDVKGQHMRVYLDDSSKNPAAAKEALLKEMNKIFNRNLKLMQMDHHYQTMVNESEELV